MSFAKDPLHMWRMAMGFGACLAVLPLVVACGGATEGGSKEPAESSSKGTNATESESDSSSSQGADNPDADTPLGDCTLGRLESAALEQACPWVAAKRCYQTREMACNCACPRSRNSQCSSGFDAGPDGHVWVSCN